MAKIWKYLLLLNLFILWYFFSYTNWQEFTLENDVFSNIRQAYKWASSVALQWYWYFSSWTNLNADYSQNSIISPPLSNTTTGITNPTYTYYCDYDYWAYIWFNSNFDIVRLQMNSIIASPSSNRYTKSHACRYYWIESSTQKNYWWIETWLTIEDLTNSTARLFWTSWFNIWDWTPDYMQLLKNDWIYYYVFWDWFIGWVWINEWKKGNYAFWYLNWITWNETKIYNAGTYWISSWNIGMKWSDLKFCQIANNIYDVTKVWSFTNPLDVDCSIWTYDLDWLNKNWTNNTKKYIYLSRDNTFDRRIKYLIKNCMFWNSCSTTLEWYLTAETGSSNVEILPRIENDIIYQQTPTQQSAYSWIMGLFVSTNNWAYPWASINNVLDVKLNWNAFCYYNWTKEYCYGLSDWYNTNTGNAENLATETGSDRRNIYDMILNWDMLWNILSAWQSYWRNIYTCLWRWNYWNYDYIAPYDFWTWFNINGTDEYKAKYWFCRAIVNWHLSWNIGWLNASWNTNWQTWYTNITWLAPSVSWFTNLLAWTNTWEDLKPFLFTCNDNYLNIAWFNFKLWNFGILANTTLWNYDFMTPISCLYGAYIYWKSKILMTIWDYSWSMETLGKGIITITTTQKEKDLFYMILNLLLASPAVFIGFKYLFWQ